MKAKLKFTNGGECIACLVGTNDPSFEEVEVYSLDLNKNHKEPYLSSFRRSKIKEKTKDLLSKHNYVFGLTTGWQKDQEYKDWCEEVINFSKSFENKTIEETQITFPTDPWGKQEVLEL